MEMRTMKVGMGIMGIQLELTSVPKIDFIKQTAL
jgi:hypothetical protein